MHLDVWTIVLQTINVIVLLFLLQRFLYKPVAAAVAQRQALALQRLDEAKSARTAADALQKQLEDERAQLKATRESVLAEARTAAHAERETLLAHAADEVETRQQEARAALQREREQARVAMTAEAGELAVQIARRLLERLPADALLAAFIEDSCHRLASLPPDQRSLIDQDLPAGVTLFTAHGLNDDQRAACRQKLGAVLGRPVELRFEVNPAVLAGVELHFQHLVLHNSWNDDLTRVLQSLQSNNG